MTRPGDPRDMACPERDVYDLLFEHAADGVLITDRDCRILRVNRCFVEMFGYAAEEALGEIVDTLIVPEEQREAALEINRRVDGGEVVRVEGVRRAKGGARRPVEILVKRVFDRGGTPLFYACYRDRSCQKRAEEALKASEERHRSLVENLPLGLYRCTPGIHGKFLVANRALLDMLGYTSLEDLQTIPVSAICLDPLERTKFSDALLAAGKVAGIERQLRRKDGSLMWGRVSARVVPFPQPDTGVCFDCVLEDITERKRMETRLRQAQRMEAIGTLAGGIAHDFNNILAGILGYTELAGLLAPKDSREKRYLEQALKAIHRAKDLVRQILTFSRMGEQEKSPSFLGPLVKEALKLLRSSLPSTVEIMSHIEDHLPLILADPTQIHQVLMNLCVNAGQAMELDGGTLQVDLRPIKIEKADPHVPLPPGAYVLLRVVDTGPGISPENKDRVFDPYFSTRDRAVNRGMGLSVVRGIVEDHRGAITVESEPGKGSVFSVYFPALVPEEPSPESGGSGRPLPSKCKARILFVDDDPVLVDLCRDALETLGYEVVAGASPEKALALFQENPAAFDLVLSDTTMPHLPGDSLARELLKIRADIPVVLLTGYSERVSRERLEELGVKGLLLKPFTLESLAATVGKLLEG